MLDQNFKFKGHLCVIMDDRKIILKRFFRILQMRVDFNYNIARKDWNERVY